MKRLLSIFLTVVLCLCLVSCSGVSDKESLWSTATYEQDTTLGNGEKTVEVKFTADGKSVNFTINTDKETLGEALLEHRLIAGEKGAYGMYVKTVNGITADYSKDKSYWAFYKNGKYMNTGVDSEKIAGSDKYEISYTK
jgi:hypothetical protein